MLAEAQNLLEFMEYVANDKDNSEAGVLKVAVSLLGDLASNVAGVGQLMQQKPYISAFVQVHHRAGAPSDPSWLPEQQQLLKHGLPEVLARALVRVAGLGRPVVLTHGDCTQF